MVMDNRYYVMFNLCVRRLLMSLRALGDRNKGRYRYSGRYDGGVAVYYYDDTPDGRVYSGQFWFKRRSYSIPHGKIVETVSGQYSGD